MKRYIHCGIQTPREGIFWVINNELITFADDIENKFNLTISPIDLVHTEVWKHIQNNYKVDDHIVPFDYYPRGRVVLSNSKNKWIAEVYIDKCVDTKYWWDKIIEAFNLYNCELTNNGTSGFGNSIYRCNNCRGK